LQFYELEGWHKEYGWPARKILEEFGMKMVADILAAKGSLGA
jgi:hypothetical protein